MCSLLSSHIFENLLSQPLILVECSVVLKCVLSRLSSWACLIQLIYTKSRVNGAIDNGSNCLLVQKVAGTEQIGLLHSKFAWLMVQEILDNGSILFLFSISKIQILSH